jgi:hypothetical protein
MMLEHRAGERGTGALLMVTAGLSRRHDGRPHQALFFFDEQSRPTRLVTNDEGAALGYDQDQPIDDLDRLVALPDDVAAAARHCLAAQLAAVPQNEDGPPACPAPPGRSADRNVPDTPLPGPRGLHDSSCRRQKRTSSGISGVIEQVIGALGEKAASHGARPRGGSGAVRGGAVCRLRWAVTNDRGAPPHRTDGGSGDR